ncbi:PstS family phosphate ABC transporter substrate-binding protein [Thermodesulfobacteriota bacterium]
MKGTKLFCFKGIGPVFTAALLVVGLAVIGPVWCADSVVKVKGATTLANGVDDLAKAYTKENPKVTVVVSGGGTTTAFKDFLSREIDIALAVRQMNPDELQAAEKSGIKPMKRVMAADGVAIIANGGNPISALTVDQVAKIFTGTYKSWKDLGGPDKPINVIISDPNRHGTPGFFKKNVLKGAEYSPDVVVLSDYPIIIKAVANRPDAVAFSTTTKAIGRKGKVKVLGIKKDADSPAVTMTRATLDDRTYPISRPAYFFWDADSKNPSVVEFVEYCTKKGVKLR